MSRSYLTDDLCGEVGALSGGSVLLLSHGEVCIHFWVRCGSLALGDGGDLGGFVVTRDAVGFQVASGGDLIYLPRVTYPAKGGWCKEARADVNVVKLENQDGLKGYVFCNYHKLIVEMSYINCKIENVCTVEMVSFPGLHEIS